MATEYMLTTNDNPYNPFTDFIRWNEFDVEMGYNTCCRLARLSETPESVTDLEEKESINQAIDQIIEDDFLNVYKRVTEDDYVTITTPESVNDV